MNEQKTFDFAKARNTDPVSSHIAADDVTPKLSKRRRAVLVALKENDGVSAKQLGAIMAQSYIQAYEWPHKRIGELVEMGFVERHLETGEKEMLCWITVKGLEYLT